jgi:ribosomal protein S18 acetylase RimI-like enzyme
MSGFPLFSRQNRKADRLRSRWYALKKRDFPAAESFLREREKTCVAACACFKQLEKAGRVWFLPGGAGNIASLLIYSRNSLFPVLGENNDIPAPRFLRRSPSLIPVYSVQGLARDAEVLETFLGGMGRQAGRRIDYDLMYTDRNPPTGVLPRGPPGLVLRPADMADIEALFPLQAAYEREEVLPPDAVFNPASCRATLERIIRREYTLAACLDGRIVGKANTNAESFTRCQIGGVYVHADYRGRGIAAGIIAALVEELIARGKGASLFVKKKNAAARAVYRRAGFTAAGEYRIAYY